MISEGIERGAREEGIAEWEQYLKDCTKESELANMLNKLAQYAQDEGGEPVRIVMISAFWYLGLEASWSIGDQVVGLRVSADASRPRCSAKGALRVQQAEGGG